MSTSASSSPPSSSSSTEITPETCKRICDHMNMDHNLSIHAMALHNLPPSQKGKIIKNAKMTGITLADYTLNYVLCDYDSCSSKTIKVPFRPVLSSPREARQRLIDEHHTSLTPSFLWLINDPFTLGLFLLCALFGIATFAGQTAIITTISSFPPVDTFINRFFGSLSNFATAVRYSWYFIVVAHYLEALYVVFQCVTRLKVTWTCAAKWGVLTFLVGYPIGGRVIALVAIDESSPKKGGKKSS